MIDDGSVARQRDKDALLYDYSKHILSLALLGIGGIVSLTQSPIGQGIPNIQVAVLLCAFAASGLCALSCSASILRAHQRDLPVGRGAWLGHQGAMLFLGMGVGGFLLNWVDALV